MRLTERFEKTLHERAIYPYSGFPLSWNVKIHNTPTVAKVRAEIAKSYLNDTELYTVHPDIDEVIEKYMQQSNLFDMITGSMWESWKDADTYSMCTPERLKKWGLPYGLKAPGVRGPFRVKYEPRGRSNGHLVVTEFEGINLCGMTGCQGYDSTWVRRLGAMVEEWDELLKPEKVYEEYVYTTAWMIQGDELDGRMAA